MTWGAGPSQNTFGQQQGVPGLGGGSPAPNQVQASSSPFEDARNAYLTYNSPTLGQYQGANNGAYRNMGYGQDMLGINQGDLQNQFAANMGDLNTQRDVNGLQQARSQMDAAAYGAMMGENEKVFGFQGAGLANTASKNLADINSQAVANGASNASGTNANRGFNFNDFQNQYGALEGNFNQQQDMLGMRKGNAEMNAQVLNRESQNLGMKAGQLQDTLSSGLAKLGLQNQISVGNLLDGIQGNNLQALQLYYQIIQQAGQYASAAGQR